MYYNSTEKETKLKKRRYTREAQLTFIKEGIILFLLSSKSHRQLNELFI
jgi:hypothetical protein